MKIVNVHIHIYCKCTVDLSIMTIWTCNRHNIVKFWALMLIINKCLCFLLENMILKHLGETVWCLYKFECSYILGVNRKLVTFFQSCVFVIMKNCYWLGPTSHNFLRTFEYLVTSWHLFRLVWLSPKGSRYKAFFSCGSMT